MQTILAITAALIISGFSFLTAQKIRTDSLPKYSYASVKEFSAQLMDIFDDQNFASSNWGVVIQSLANGEYFYKRNEDKLFIPASNLKLFTTAAALSLLGNNYKFKTELYKRGEIDGSVLNGDIIIKGYGDPTISGRFYNDDMTKVFSNWADSIANAGIDEIKGQIIGDDDSFDKLGLGEGWAWDYESEWYAAPSGALAFNDNCIDIYVKPSSLGQRAAIEYLPYNKYTTVLDKVITCSKDSATTVSVHRERGSNLISVAGRIKENSKPMHYYSSVNNPTQYFVVVLKDILQDKGIKVSGYPIDSDDLKEGIDYRKTKLLFTHHSPPLGSIIRIINKDSQNFIAEQLLKTIGYEKYKFGSAHTGILAIRLFLESIGINTDNFMMVDGSGLSHLNLVTPRQIVNLLEYMQRHENFDYFYSSFPIAGVDGTLANRLQRTKAENNARGKTGYLDGVRTLAGYIQTGDKELVAFAMLVNNFIAPIKLAENLQDLVCIRLSNFRRK